MVLEQFILGPETTLFWSKTNAFAELKQCLCGPNPMLWQAESNAIERILQ
jgi:hypothetical protein